MMIGGKYLFLGLFFLPTALSLPKWLSSLVESDDSSESWTGRWFPERTTEPFHAMEGEFRNMGSKDDCDDGKLGVDFDGDPSAYICMNPRNRIRPDGSLPPVLEFESIPPAYEARHKCMNESIVYSMSVPTYGPHRQLWPVYGEYKYVPVQRWIHTLEHGGIVALYHPCADLRNIRVLKEAVRACLWRHVITPFEYLDESRPFILVAWGVRLRMPWVSRNAVMDFIQKYALKGPEAISKDGQFDRMLIEKSEIVSDQEDSQLCPRPLAHD